MNSFKYLRGFVWAICILTRIVGGRKTKLLYNMNSDLNFSNNNLTALLDCINRPFDFHPDGRVPDGNPNSTLQLVDYYDDNGLNTPIANTGGPAIVFDAVGMTYLYGQNVVRSFTYDTYTCTSRADALYGPVYFFIDNTGALIDFSAISGDGLLTTQQAYFWSNDPVNMLQILGAVNGILPVDALINAMRVLSAGIRFWPTIELVTDSTTVAVSRYYGCQMTATSISNAANNGVNFYSAMRNSPQYHEYANSAGISARFQPSQQGSIIKALHLNALENIYNENLETDGVYFPVVLARLTIDQQLTPNGEDSQSFPVRSYFRTILEGSLNQPTPLQATRVPYLPEWEDKVAHFSFRDDLYPSVVSGHSFKAVEREVVKYMGKDSQALAILREAKKMYSGVAAAFRSGKTIVKTVNKGRNKKKKKNGNGNGKSKGRPKVTSGAKQQLAQVVDAEHNLQSKANTSKNVLVQSLLQGQEYDER